MTSKERHTIAIIDDHPLFRRGVRELLDLEQGLDVVGEAGTREEAIKLVRRTEPDLTILDLNMKGCSGVESSRHSRTRIRRAASWSSR